AQARAMSTRLKLEERIFEVLENDDVRHRVLLATCILASPVDCNMLTTMLDLPRLKVEGAVAELADSGLLELENLLDPPRLGDAGRARERVPKSGLGEIGITSPVRRAALSGGSELFGSSAGTLSYGVLTDVVWQLVSWSRSQIASLDRWEADKDQFRELVDSLADLLGVFEAGSWLMELHSQDISGLDSRFLDTWLWLGADLAYILPYAGRWAESKRIVQYLEKHIDKAHHPRDFRREMQILESRVVGHLAVRPEEVRQAADLALAAVASAEQDIAGLDSETSPRDRSALEFHLARARIRLGQTLLLEEKYVEARDQFAAVYEDAFSNGHGRVRGRRLKYAADAAGWLADVMGKTLPSQPSDDEVAEILRVLDDGFTALVELSNRRDRGQQAVLRGEVLIRHRNITGARRSLARALVISHEFQDRYLEARSLLGLASTDGRRSLAEKAASIFADVAPDLQRAAKELFYSLPPIEPDPLEASSKRPSVVLFMGLPGTGKTAALRTAKLVLTSWGMTPQIEGSTSSLIERMKRAEDPDFDEIRHRLVAIADETRRLRGGVVLARVPLADPGELFGDWDESDRLVEESLCVHLTAPSEILESRNRQRHAEGVDYSKLSESVPADGGEQRSSWASWVEVSGGAYVELRSDIPIRDFQESVTDALALSFLEVEPLLAQRL
ncbi:MAG TPA: hypothetical protein VFP42_09100, partial [Acidimicrobiia bacterium]|nr:hypothetical protein [Acidimicrobiia bacterium]